jgi:putative peptide zinc metalloprotease protein
VPDRAEGVVLMGEMEESGYERPPSLARRGDGQVVQLTALLYLVLAAVDGRRSYRDIAEVVTAGFGRRVSAENVEFLVEQKLRPLGLLKEPDGSTPQVAKANPLLALRLRVVLTGERLTNRLTRPFSVLFHPPVVALACVAFVAVVGWLLLAEGLGTGTRQALYEPSTLLLVFALTAVSAGFHEFGHAAACRYGGATPGVMGAGIYLVWPAFYTDVTDTYRLSRRGRLRTDLGGLYFNALFALATTAVWAVTGADVLLLLVPLQLLQMLHQLLPIIRLDGYYVLADLTGVPDLFARVKPTVTAALPGREPDDAVTALKPWVRRVVTAWVLVLVPLLGLSLLMAVISAPRVAATAWDSLRVQVDSTVDAAGDGRILNVLAGLVSCLALVLPTAGLGYSLARLGKRGGRALWRRAGARPTARAGLVLALVAVVGGLSWLWWPNGEYRPIQPGERGTLSGGLRAAQAIDSGRPALTAERRAELGGAPTASTDGGGPPTTTVPGGSTPSNTGPADGQPPAPTAPSIKDTDGSVTTGGRSSLTTNPTADPGPDSSDGSPTPTTTAGEAPDRPPATTATSTTSAPAGATSTAVPPSTTSTTSTTESAP